VTEFPRPLGELASPPDLLALFALDAPAPLHSDDAVREAVRTWQARVKKPVDRPRKPGGGPRDSIRGERSDAAGGSPA
jgi:hypothetical protein